MLGNGPPASPHQCLRHGPGHLPSRRWAGHSLEHLPLIGKQLEATPRRKQPSTAGGRTGKAAGLASLVQLLWEKEWGRDQGQTTSWGGSTSAGAPPGALPPPSAAGAGARWDWVLGRGLSSLDLW